MSLPSCFCILHWSTVSLKMPTYNSTLHLRNYLPRKIGVVWMFASYLRSEVTGSFCTINDFACFCIWLCLLVQNNEWYTCPGACKLINFMDVDVAYFFFWHFVLVSSIERGIAEKSYPELDLTLNGNSWTEIHFFFVTPVCLVLCCSGYIWCHFNFQWVGFDAILERQGSSSFGLIYAVCKLFTLQIGFTSAVVLHWLAYIPLALLVHCICFISQGAQWILMLL